MKRIILILTTIVILIVFLPVGAAAAEMSFTDAKSDDWFYKNLQELTEKNIASGYPDGTFKPDNTLKFEEFVKMLVLATKEEFGVQEDGHEWYEGYIDSALENKYITELQKTLIEQNIDRQTMAEILYNMLSEKEVLKVYTDAELEYLSSRLIDINKTGVKTLTINGIGVISGYPDKTFKPTGTLTRAEAVAVISRVINPELRNPVMIVARAEDLDKISIEQTNYGELKKENIENVIKVDTSMFPIQFGKLVITGIEKYVGEKSPYNSSFNLNGKEIPIISGDALALHAYAIESNSNNFSNYYHPISINIGLINKSGEEFPGFTFFPAGVKEKSEELFPDVILMDKSGPLSDVTVELNKPFTLLFMIDEDIDNLFLWEEWEAAKNALEVKDIQIIE